MSKIYRDYFDIDPLFFPSVNEKLINSGKVSWKNFYPHETFVKLLDKTIAVLSGQLPLSIVVEGEYGTGKPYAALTIKCLLEASDEEVQEYFDKYGLNRDLCQKFITVKNAGKIITVHRIGSSSIHSDQDLILAMQTSIMAVLAAHGIENRGEASLSDAALKWLDKKANHDYFNELISEDKYAWTFGGRSVDELMVQLRSGSADEVAELMRDIMAVADDNGITALRLDIQGMAAWIESVIEQNHLTAILFIWDEFSEYFQNNPNSLTGFQILTEISEAYPFYFMLVCHRFGSLFQNTETAKKIKDRFGQSVEIALPENMAFRLMAQAMRPTSDVVLFNEWQGYKAELNNYLESARNSVRDGMKRSAVLGQKTIISDAELQGIVPIHPYAGLLLKHLAVLFSSNQRSMFDFIINEDADMKGFKWFIDHYGPLDDTNLLTVDLLWDFFRGKGESGINEDVRVILDSYELLDSEKLTPDEQRVMKTVLLLEATSMRVNDVELLKPNAQNVELAFSGTDWHKGKAYSIAEKLVRDGLIFIKPVAGGKREYAVSNSQGDIRRIREIKAQIIKETKTQDLIVTADLLNAIQLPAPIAGRFIMEAAVAANFTNELNKLEHNIPADRFNVMVTFALNDDESAILKDRISRTVNEGKTSVLIINAGITPMGAAMFEEYAENMAYSRYYAQSDRTRAAHYQNQANKYLSDWKYKVQTGPFMLYDSEHPSGQRMANQAALQFELGALNHSRYPCGLEQYNVIANMFSKGPLAQGAECGITQKLSGTFKSANEKTSLSTALAGAWQVPDYWEEPSKQSLPIVRIKREVERLIHEGFAQNSGRVSMLTIYDALTQAPFGFMPNNISAFVLGFVMKEYANGDYFWSNGMTNVPLTTDKLKTMIANAINERFSHSNHFREEFLVTMSEQQQAFLKCTAAAFHINESQCGSIESARDQLRISMKRLSFPIWCVKYILDKLPHTTPTATLAGIIDDFCSIANTGNAGRSESELAEEIGTLVLANPGAGTELGSILTDANCRSGMQAYIAQFEGGILQKLAGEIQDGGAYIDSVRDKFNADAANWVWNTDTADEKIRDVILDYHIIAESNKSLTPKCTTMAGVVEGWKTKTKNIHIAYDAMKTDVGELAPLLEMLHTISRRDALPEQHKARFYELLLSRREAFDRFYADQLSVFKQVAAPFIGDLDDNDIADLYGSFPSGQFIMSGSEYFQFVEAEVKKYLSTQLKQQVRQLWKDKTGTETPMAWSSEYRTPISCMFGGDARENAKHIFDIINKESPTDDEANQALSYLTGAGFYERIADASKRDRCFMKNLVGDYATLLDDPDAVRQYLQDHTTVQPYDWLDNSAVPRLIHAMADQKYKNGDNKRAQAVIDNMKPDTLRKYMKDLISDNVRVGIEILKNSRGGEVQ